MLLVMLAFAGCAMGVTGQTQPPYAPYSPANKRHRYPRKVTGSPRRRVPSVPAFRKMRVATGNSYLHGHQWVSLSTGKSSHSRPAGITCDLLAALSDLLHGSVVLAARNGRCRWRWDVSST